MSEVVRIRTKHGQAHADFIGWLQEVVSDVIENKVATLYVRGIKLDGEEISVTLYEDSDRTRALKIVGMLALAQQEQLGNISDIPD